MWPSKQHVVKVGGRGRSEVPTSMVEDYVDRYPSQLPGGSLEGALPPGSDEARVRSRKLEKQEYDSDNPRPDLEHYDPSKVKLPDHEDDAVDAGRPPRNTDAAGPKKLRRSK
jgi:hypothetical protein